MWNKRLWLALLCIFAISILTIAQEETEPPEGEATPTATAEEEETTEEETPEVGTVEASTEIDVTPGGEVLSTEEVTELPAMVEAIPPEIAAHAEQWPLPHKDYRNTRATFNSPINASNVNQLELAWSFPIPGRAEFGAAASAPLIVGNVVYFQDLESNTFAFDFTTGAVLWEQMYGSPVLGPNGPAVGYGKVFIAKSVEEYAALNIETGEEVWTTPLPDEDDVGPASSVQPLVYDGLVYMTSQTGGYTGGVSGHIFTLDQETGEIEWEFQVVEEGFWGNPEVNSGGGVWFPPAIDTERGLAFMGTGNPAPFPGTFQFPNASSREEPNLYTNSMLALDHDTGELVWYNYVNPNDIFDLDFQNSPILAAVDLQGRQRDIVIGSGKIGHVMAFDRQTGEMIWDTPVGIHQNDDLTEMTPDETVVVYPGILGGVETPMAYADGTVYAPIVNLPTTHEPTGHGAQDATEALQNSNANTPTGQGTGELVALDAATGQVKWSHEFPSEVFAGATVVNDLIFTATFDGMIYALDRASGQTVWTYQASGGINSWPAVSGNTIVWAAGFGGEPSLFALRLPVEAITEATEEATPEVTEEATEESTPKGEAEAAEEATEEATPEGEAEATEQAGAAQTGEYVSVDQDNQTVNLTVIASLDDTNGGLNFNGYANGDATFTVPAGWTINVSFENQSNLPHSAMVVPPDAVEQNDIGSPAFDGAASPDPNAGTTQMQEFSFTAGEEGEYALACGVPGHASQGQWINFVVGSSDVEPSFEASGG